MNYENPEIFNELPQFVYIADIENHEILFGNDSLKNALKQKKIKGEKCYKILYNRNSPCAFCPNALLTENKIYNWEQKNLVLKTRLRIQDKLITFQGKKARLSIFNVIPPEEKQTDILNDLLNAEHILTQAIQILEFKGTLNNRIKSVLKLLGSFLDCDRIYLFKTHNLKIDSIFEWCNENVLPKLRIYKNKGTTPIKHWFEAFEKNESIFVFDSDEIKKIENPKYEHIIENNLKSFFAIPIIADKKIIGFIGADNPPQKVINYKNILISLAYFISSAIVRDTNEKEFQKKYKSAQISFESISKNYIATMRVNLTQNCIEYGAEYNHFFKNELQTDAYDNLYSALLRKMPRQIDRVVCCKVLNRKNLIENYENGATTVTVEFHFREKDNYLTWLQTVIILIRRAGTEDLVGCFYFYDIKRAKIFERMTNKFLIDQYDFIGTIDASTENFETIHKTENVKLGQNNAHFSHYTDTINNYVNNFVPQEQKDLVKTQFRLANIKRFLNSNTQEIIECIEENDKKSKYKRFEFFYLDKESQLICLCVNDYTKIQQQQFEQEQDLRLALFAAKDASNAKTEFMSRMSHEIRTPINAISGFNELIQQELGKDKLNKEKISNFVNQSKDATKYLLVLINDILDTSKIESNKITLNPVVFNINEFIDNLNSIIEPSIKRNHINYSYTKINQNSQFYYADSTRIHQILINIINNAIKFTPRNGTISVTSEIINIEDNADVICFTVKDSGIGISENFIEKIFTPFAREHNGQTSKYEGTGLGLPISKRLALLMDGDITVQSKKNEGSIFKIILKLKCEKQTQKKEIHEPKFDINELQNLKILVCEDNKVNLAIEELLLENVGCIVETASNGKEGVEKFEQTQLNEIDAILMDIRMPIMSGHEATQNIRNLDRADAKKIPIIALSADAYEEDTKKSLSVGMNLHLSKPLNADILYETLYNLCVKNKKY